jgi:hypothetical protein
MSKQINELLKSLLFPSGEEYRLFFKTSRAECLSELITTILFNFIKMGSKQGHFIISQDVDESIKGQCELMMKAKLCSISTIPLDENALVDIKVLSSRIRRNTLLIIMPLVAASGAINNIEMVSLLAKKNNIPLCCNIDNIFPFVELSLEKLGIDIFTFTSNLKSNLIYPQFDLPPAQPVCTMGIAESVITGYGIDKIGPKAEFHKQTLVGSLKSIIVFSSANVRAYEELKQQIIKYFSAIIAPIVTVHGIILLNKSIKTNGQFKLFPVLDKFVLSFPLNVEDSEVQALFKINKHI